MASLQACRLGDYHLCMARVPADRGPEMREPDSAALRRWEKSAARADGLMDLGLERAVQHYFSRVFPLAVLPAIAAGLAVAWIWDPDRGTIIVSGAYFGLVLAGIAAMIVGIIYNSKKISLLVQPRRLGVTIGLTGAEAKSIQNQILGKESLDPQQLQILRGAAIQLRERMARGLISTAGLVLLGFGQAVGLTRMDGFPPIGLILLILAVPLLLITYGWMVRQFHQTSAFLVKTSSGGLEPPTSQS